MTAFDDRYGHQDYEFYDQYFKRDLWLSFKFFFIWTMWPNFGRVHLKSLFSLEIGVVLDSKQISRTMKELGLKIAPKRRIQ